MDSIRRLQSVQRYIDGICRVAARADSSLLGNGTQYPSADSKSSKQDLTTFLAIISYLILDT